MKSVTTEERVLPDMVPLVVTTAGAIAALYYGQSFLQPLALAVLFCILLNASSERIAAVKLGRFKIRRWMAMVVSISLAGMGVLLIARILSGQASAVTQAWPRYVARFEDILSRLSHVVGDHITNQIKYQVSNMDLSSGVTFIAGKTGTILADIVLVVLFIIFILPTQGQFTQKVAAIFPKQSHQKDIRDLVGSMTFSIRKYIFIKTIMSISTGLLSYLVLKLVGVDFAETWALLIFLLNYIPNVGSIIGVVFPAVLALVQFETLGPFLTIAILLSAIQFVIGNLIEPVFMGKVLNLSPVVVLLALSFWGSLWGIVGMFMSVPTTVVLMMFCAQLPQLRWLAILLSEDASTGVNGK